MVHNPVSVRLFGIIQGVFLALIVGVVLIYKKRGRMRESPTAFRLGGDSRDGTYKDPRSSIRRAPPPPSGSDEGAGKRPAAGPNDRLGSALPNWSSDTPPHEILGVHPSADAATVEAAYKALLKRYHPDRFASSSWGAGYQNRAHQVVLMLQEARARMLGKR